METLFHYQTRLSFGLGAEMLLVETDGKKITFTGGEPMHPKKIGSIPFTQDALEDITTCPSSAQNMEYLKHKYIR